MAHKPRCTCPRNHFVPNINCAVHREAAKRWRDQHKPRMTTANDLVLCQSADGWSLHAPGSTDEAIASGDAPYILSGTGEPTEADWQQAFERWLERNRR